jgi:uncharacterized membrane protein
MITIQALLLPTTLLCGLVTGLVYTFAVVVMPGIKALDDHDFLKAFKAMDGVIQNNEPKFVLVWIGSVLSLLALCAVSIFELSGLDRVLVVLATVLYVLGVQAPTLLINVPLNNKLKSLSLTTLSEEELRQARLEFEPIWIKWNSRRTVVSIMVFLLLIGLAIKL